MEVMMSQRQGAREAFSGCSQVTQSNIASSTHLDMNVWIRRCRADSEVVGTFVKGPREQ